ncbi:TetR/AcrR family transcriptional regulator [Streptomyces kunmingensis]|uniref:TetR/AcrR family transcriptional regulator n=1 Tax=Streptomyces kunmingensis TaxID=68225 RepID=A0ABU6C8W7_9ACTN|nr:helix-turn-helix domain-containing protein [Streptomyces kunmingensis]MEB3960919.1 TetR/AcrR family transcriptional regulator [Streptomyces kunmingensis]
MAATTGTTGPRADMVRNRRLLLDAATEAFAEQGLDASMGDIAQRAGLAKGTVFRHFPTKEDLLSAIMLRLLDRLAGSAGRLLDADDAAAALREFMADGVETLAADRAFCEVIGRPSLQQSEVRDAIADLCVAVEALTARARDQRVIRDDVTGTDIVLLLGGIHQTAAPLLDTQPQAWRRYLELALDGLRTTHPSRLPEAPPGRPEISTR